MTKHTLTIATRESPLALWQANWVKSRLEIEHPSLHIKLLGITTIADKMLETPLTKIGGKGLFVKELEEALLDGRADMAVHSMKDVPMDLPQGLSLPVMCEREDPRDVFVALRYDALSELPSSAIVGTSSLRRQSQIAFMRPDLALKPLRGNVNSRLIKLNRNEYSAIILAAAGLKRLKLENCIRSYLTLEQSLPAAGQGVMGIECRADDVVTQELIAPLNHFDSSVCVMAERAMCKKLGGGCYAPVAAYAEIIDKKIYLRGLVANENGTIMLRAESRDDTANAELLGVRVAEDLIAQGALQVLAALK